MHPGEAFWKNCWKDALVKNIDPGENETIC